MAIDTSPIPPISPHNCLTWSLVWARVALDKLSKITERSYEEGVAKDQVEEALASLECAERSLEK